MLDDMDGVWLPYSHRYFYGLLNRYMDLLDDFIGLLNGNVHFPDYLEWNFPDYFVRYWPLDRNVLGLVHWVRHMFHDIDLDGVGLGHWHSYFLAHRVGLRHWYGDLDVSGHFNWHATDDVLNDRLELVSSSTSNWAANAH